MKRITWLVMAGVAAFLLNPFIGCGPWFHYGAKEMRAAVVGKWSLTVSGAPDQVTILEIEQASAPRLHGARAGWVSAARACGDRELLRTAGACLDTTTMPLEVKVVGGGTPGRATGKLEVPGTSFDEGWLKLELEGQVVRATLSPGGIASKVVVEDSRATATLVRLAGAN